MRRAIILFLCLSAVPAAAQQFRASTYSDLGGTARDAPLLRLHSGDVCRSYPSLFSRREGQTLLNFTVGGDGQVTSVRVTKSSGEAVLDRWAERCVQSWEFEPPRRGGQPVDVDADAAANFVFHRMERRQVTWQTPMVRNAVDVATMIIQAKALACMRAAPGLRALVGNQSLVTGAQVHYFGGEVSRVRVTVPSGKPELDRIAADCFTGVEKDPLRAKYIHGIGYSYYAIPWLRLASEAP